MNLEDEDEKIHKTPLINLMDLTEYWLNPATNVEIYKLDIVGAAAFDRTTGILYIIERLADDYQSVVHVFQIAP